MSRVSSRLRRPRRASLLRLAAAALLALLVGTAPALAIQGPDPAPASSLLLNERHPLPGLATGGLLEGPAALSMLAAAGYRTVIDLRSDAEVGPGVAEAAATAGLDYERIPIAGEGDLDLASARALDALLDDPDRYPVALVCRSGNRSGALLAVEAFWLDRSRPEEALELGRNAGLTRLEPSIRMLLGLPPAEPASEEPNGPEPEDAGAKP